MSNVNIVVLDGNLGADPELRYTSSGSPVANMRIASNRQYKDKAGNSHEQTDWFPIVVFGKQAETCQEYLSKGRRIMVEGRLQTRQWEDRDGNKRYTTEVVARSVTFLGGPRKGNTEAPNLTQDDADPSLT